MCVAGDARARFCPVLCIRQLLLLHPTMQDVLCVQRCCKKQDTNGNPDSAPSTTHASGGNQLCSYIIMQLWMYVLHRAYSLLSVFAFIAPLTLCISCKSCSQPYMNHITLNLLNNIRHESSPIYNFPINVRILYL